MLKNKEIEQIAKDYVESFGEVLPNFKYDYANKKEFTYKYYFDFVFKQVDGQVSLEPPVAGGACGFCIDKKTREVINVTFAELGEIQFNERKLNTAYNEITNVKESNKSLSWLKDTYNLSSKQLLGVIRIVKSKDLKKEIILEQLDEIIKIVKND